MNRVILSVSLWITLLAAMQPDRARMVTAELAQMRAKANAIAPASKPGAGG